MRRFLRFAFIASAFSSALVATAAPVGADVPDVDLAANPLTNPWGYTDGQVVTYRQAQEVLIYELNWERVSRGIAPVQISYDNTWAECNNAQILAHSAGGANGYGHYTEECGGYTRGSQEVVAGDGANDRYPSGVVGLWESSTHGHNEWIFHSGADTASIAVTCAEIQGVLQNVTSMHLSNSVSVHNLSDNTLINPRTVTPDRAPFGVGCDTSGSFRFHYWPDVLAMDEYAPSLNAPELWHRFQVARLYSAYFHRLPDTEGWAFWNLRAGWQTTYQISEYFEDSPEFKTMYGPELTDAEFITLVYANVLDRRPDAGGFEFWNTQMGQGMPRGEVMVHFSESPEYIAKIAPFITGEYWNGDVQSSYLAAAPHTPRPAIPG